MKLDFNSIPKFCINLKRSVERRDLVKLEFKKVGIKFQFFNAIDRNDIIVPELSEKLNENKQTIFPLSPGIYACMSSHLELFKMAAALKLPAICVFEDDVVLCDDFNERIKYIEGLDIDFDFFSLGGHFSNTIPGAIGGCAEETAHNHILRNKSLGGSYGYIITQKVYEFCIRNLTYNFGMDQFLSDIVYPRFVCYSFIPFLVSCRPCKSEITGDYWEYECVKYHYQKEAIEDFNVPYKSPYITNIDSNIKAVDKFRENKLNEERNG